MRRRHLQTPSAHKRHRTTTTEAVTVTGTIVPTPGEGAATTYQRVKTLVVREDGSNNPGRYILNGPGRVVIARQSQLSRGCYKRHLAAGFAAECPLRRPFLGSTRSGTLCARIPLSKSSARKSSREPARFRLTSGFQRTNDLDCRRASRRRSVSLCVPTKNSTAFLEPALSKMRR